MELGLKGRHVAILAADGVSREQLDRSRSVLAGTGAVVDVLSTHDGTIEAASGETVAVDRSLEICRAGDYDVLLLPGGADSVATLRGDGRAIQFVREFMVGDKPVMAVEAGVELLIAADAVAGRAVAVPTHLVERVVAAGGESVDAPVHVDERLITVRQVDDPAFGAAIVRELTDGVDEARVDELSAQSFPASDPPPGPVAVGGEGATASHHLDPDGGRPSP